MYYYEVLVSSQRYHGQGPLTYSFKTDLKPGNIVEVPLKKQLVKGVVIQKVSRPDFKTKPIEKLTLDHPLPATSLDLMKWLISYYPANLGATISQFIPAGLKQNLNFEGGSSLPKTSLPPLTKEQVKVLNNIDSSSYKSFLLHGVTGSGKTRIYIELARKQFSVGKSSLILTPEIGLTTQLVKDFERVFGASVIVLHSSLTESTRTTAWARVLESTEPLVVIGPRSALFAPFNRLGLVVVDESHETAYKQEQSPYYQTLRVAGKLTSLHSAIFISGSATPSISEYYFASKKNTPVLEMKDLAVKNNHAKANISIVDNKDKALFARNPYISDLLVDAIAQTISNKKQALVFLNRRGSARLLLCQECGWQALCPRCDLPLIYHSDTHDLTCHTCGYKNSAVSVCPVCKSSDIIFKSIGTKYVADTLSRMFPSARVMRFDTDNKKAERLDQNYSEVLSGDVDIIVGTQIIAKGLDLPNLGLVGVVIADTALSFPDYSAEERTYQLITQLIGRVGRGHQSGAAIIQTYNPGNPAIKAAIAGDWDGFYLSQLKERETFGFPPFFHILKITLSRSSQKSAIGAASKLAEQLSAAKLRIIVVGPSPAFHEKVRGKYNWQIIVKSKDRAELLKVIYQLPAGANYDIDPTNLL